jgi:hypothetical protein
LSPAAIVLQRRRVEFELLRVLKALEGGNRLYDRILYSGVFGLIVRTMIYIISLDSLRGGDAQAYTTFPNFRIIFPFHNSLFGSYYQLLSHVLLETWTYPSS